MLISQPLREVVAEARGMLVHARSIEERLPPAHAPQGLSDLLADPDVRDVRRHADTLAHEASRALGVHPFTGREAREIDALIGPRLVGPSATAADPSRAAGIDAVVAALDGLVALEDRHALLYYSGRNQLDQVVDRDARRAFEAPTKAQLTRFGDATRALARGRAGGTYNSIATAVDRALQTSLVSRRAADLVEREDDLRLRAQLRDLDTRKPAGAPARRHVKELLALTDRADTLATDFEALSARRGIAANLYEDLVGDLRASTEAVRRGAAAGTLVLDGRAHVHAWPISDLLRHADQAHGALARTLTEPPPGAYRAAR